MLILLPPLLLVGSGALLHGLFGGYPEKVERDAKLSKKEQAIIAACADTFFPAGGPITVSGKDARLVQYMERYVEGLAPDQRVLVRLLFWFIEHGPWAFGPKRVRFSSLDFEARLAVLERMRTSPIYFRRIAFLSMRTMLTMGYLSSPEVMAQMKLSFDRDPWGRGSRPDARGEGATQLEAEGGSQ